jgi:segregation and condensation protein A
VSVGEFEGPLDLLLHLVRINEVEITDIPVARICDQFHEYLMRMEELNLDIAGEYIYEAAQLIQIKSRMLLPRRKSGESDEGEEDPRQELVERLLEYQRLKGAAQTLAEVHRMREGVWTRLPQPLDLGGDDEEAIDLGDVSLFDLLGALQNTLTRYDREHPEPLHLPHEVFSVREQFDRLLGVLDAGRPYDLLHDLRQRRQRGEAVAAFLAILELARLNLIRLHQTDDGELLLYRTTRQVRAEELETIQG